MEWHLLFLALPLWLGALSSASAQCSSQCSRCSDRTQGLPEPLDPLICTLECEASPMSGREWGRCRLILSPLGALLGPRSPSRPEPPAGDPEEEPRARRGGLGLVGPARGPREDEDRRAPAGAYGAGGGRKAEGKRYGGFLRRYPKSSPPGGDGPHKRYGGFMRRVRPKLRWDNQKRYGAVRPRPYKLVARGEGVDL
ncbi:proenkephalin-B [Tachyglossus aculeatus]|uniref:proenkephalin-B n=1 Tax=Tachyglossus aculeatus TaxID=9261 RepID=UPI0018F6D182|nr:proenkephalin-B [Tachyglossus aculeatus]XP_038606407.1 proenkephalin-B [Tachyglossus aculeatus]XP_038606408.1 proenkephalin-B [Tachyglossus aculeatus]